MRRYGYQPGVDLTLPPLSSCLPRLRRTAQRALRGVDGDVAEDVLLAAVEASGVLIIPTPTPLSTSR